ncbi:TPA: hypothetical protein RJX14_001476 [Legionella pneumophila]|nr:hypothetical protein [Legionella pneumophila]
MIVEQEKNSQWNLETLARSLKDDIPNLNISQSLNEDIKESVLKTLQEIISRKCSTPISVFESYENKIRYFKTLTPLFYDQRALNLWNDLFIESPQNTIIFVEVLFEFERLYEEAIEFYRKKQEDVKELKKRIKMKEKLFQTLSEGKALPNPDMMAHLICDLDALRKRLAETNEALKNNSYFTNGFWPLSRKKNVNNALHIFFVRKIYYFFRTEFRRPMYSYINELMGVIFKVSWDHDEIKKHCKRMNSIIRGRFGDLKCD